MPMIGSMDDLPPELIDALGEMIGKTRHGTSNRGVFGKNKILPEAVMMRVEEAAKLYAASLHACPYAIGDWVTPREGYGINGTGNPYMVVDLMDHPAPAMLTDGAGSTSNGRRTDMRVMTLLGDDVACFWAESYSYELYDAKVHGKVE